MKTQNLIQRTFSIITLVTVAFFLQTSFLFAGTFAGNDAAYHGTKCKTCISNDAVLLLAPILPVEATFSDEAIFSEINLAPATPAEATFEVTCGLEEYTGCSDAFLIAHIFPVVPTEADFND